MGYLSFSKSPPDISPLAPTRPSVKFGGYPSDPKGTTRVLIDPRQRIRRTSEFMRF
jgi:hypothetical protein